MATEVFDALRSLGLSKDVDGFVEERRYRRIGTRVLGLPVLGDDALESVSPSDTILVGGIGSPLRAEWFSRLERLGLRFREIVHPGAQLGSDVRLSEGVFIGAGAVATTNIRLGRHSIVNVGATISHDTEIGDYGTIGPGVSIGGSTKVGERTWVGIGSTILNGIEIGPRSFIGAGSVVTKDLPADTLAYGVPARSVRRLTQSDWNELV